MSKSTPSLLALLGLVAVAGYQNRDRIREMLPNVRSDKSNREGSDSRGLIDEIGRLFGGTAGDFSGGLNELIDRFRTGGRSEPAESWISHAENMPVQERDIEDVLGDEMLAELSGKTGLSRTDLLQRLSSTLPLVVDGLTPNGRLPTAS
jgi:uncharacterized protein YidB (DUF937 family)